MLNILRLKDLQMLRNISIPIEGITTHRSYITIIFLIKTTAKANINLLRINNPLNSKAF